MYTLNLFSVPETKHILEDKYFIPPDFERKQRAPRGVPTSLENEIDYQRRWQHLFFINLGKETEILNDFGSIFRIYRNTLSPKIISISLWKANPGYIFNLSTSLLWWPTFAEQYFPGWNVRFYMDASIFSKKILKQDVADWNGLIKQILKHKNVEIWFYETPWARDDEKCFGCHKNTFGSLMRYHVFNDPNVEIAIVRNLELLSSPQDAQFVEKWERGDKKILLGWFPLYACLENAYTPSIHKLCKSILGAKEIKDMNMMLTGMFGMKKTLGESSDLINFEDIMSLLNNDEVHSANFEYGVDEIILTKLVRSYIGDHPGSVEVRVVINFDMVLDFMLRPQYIYYIERWRQKYINHFERECGFERAEFKGLERKQMLVKSLERLDSCPVWLEKFITFCKEIVRLKTPEENKRAQILSKCFMDATEMVYNDNRGEINNAVDLIVKSCDFPKKLSDIHLLFYTILENCYLFEIAFPGWKLKTKKYGTGTYRQKTAWQAQLFNI